MVEAPAPLAVQPTGETLSHWADHLVPELDVWYRDDSALDLDLSGCMVMPRADYLNHPTSRDIRYVNAYLHWQMPSTVSRMIVSGPDWITGIDDDRFLTKNGQSRFNPIRVVDWATLSADWRSASCSTWRRRSPEPGTTP